MVVSVAPCSYSFVEGKMVTMVVIIPSIFILIHVSVWNDHINPENEQLNIMYAQQMVFKLLRGSLKKQLIV